MQDTELVRRIVAGHDEAFAELLERYQPRVYRLACRLVTPADAEDVTQEVFIEVFKGLKRFRGESSFSTWLYRVAFNRCQTYRLREARQTLPQRAETPDTPREFESLVESAPVVDALERLDEEHRSALILHELHGLTYAEIAEIVSVPIGTVKSRVFNALRKLRALLQEASREAV
jgi:RNA polymerase sigma-70 factor (ECF subfamily)